MLIHINSIIAHRTIDEDAYLKHLIKIESEIETVASIAF